MTYGLFGTEHIPEPEAPEPTKYDQEFEGDAPDGSEGYDEDEDEDEEEYDEDEEELYDEEDD